MRSTLELRRSAWKRRALLGVPLVIVAISFLRSSPAGPGASGRGEPDRRSSRLGHDALTQAGAPCPPGEVAIAPADVGVGDAVRCLPVEGTSCEGSRWIRSTVA